MKITRVEYKLNTKNDKGIGLVSICNVILDNCLVLSDIKLCKAENNSFYLLMPSKQDAFAELKTFNASKGIEIDVPERRFKGDSKKLKWDEYFHPVTREFYAYLSNTISNGYLKKVETGEDYILG